jgi:hypothetical protein
MRCYGTSAVTKEGKVVDDYREAQPDPPVLEGEDHIPRQPASERDPFVPETGPRPGEEKAWRIMRLAWIPLLIAIGFVIWAVLR